MQPICKAQCVVCQSKNESQLSRVIYRVRYGQCRNLLNTDIMRNIIVACDNSSEAIRQNW